MTAILALATIGVWNYSGFLEEPGGAPPAPPAPAAPARPLPLPAPPAPPDPPEVPAAPPPPPPPPPARETTKVAGPRPAAAAPPAAPARYQLADAFGQVWEHPDPVHLRSFVESRNRSFAVPSYQQVPALRSSTCANGRCR